MPGLSMQQEMRMAYIKKLVKAYGEAMAAEGIPQAKIDAIQNKIIWGGTQTQEKAPWER